MTRWLLFDCSTKSYFHLACSWFWFFRTGFLIIMKLITYFILIFILLESWSNFLCKHQWFFCCLFLNLTNLIASRSWGWILDELTFLLTLLLYPCWVLLTLNTLGCIKLIISFKRMLFSYWFVLFWFLLLYFTIFDRIKLLFVTFCMHI